MPGPPPLNWPPSLLHTVLLGFKLLPTPLSLTVLYCCCRSAHTRLDFSARPAPAELAPKLARGDRRQTCLVTAARTAADKTKGRAGNSSSSAADTLLPEDLHYQVCDENLLDLIG